MGVLSQLLIQLFARYVVPQQYLRQSPDYYGGFQGEFAAAYSIVVPIVLVPPACRPLDSGLSWPCARGLLSVALYLLRERGDLRGGCDLVLTGPPAVKRNLPRDGAKAGQLKGECNVPGETFSGLTDDLDAIAEGKERDDRTIHRHRRLRRAPRSPIRVLPLAARADSVTHTRRRPPRGGATADGETGCIDCAVCVVECAEPL